MSAQDWKPPPNADPSSILHSAVEDRREGRFARALAKHVWYHNNAVRLEPSQFGVRLSFALGYWMDLAQDYQDAKTALIEVRNETEQAFSKKLTHDLFIDLAAINNRLDEQHRTVEIFKRVVNVDEQQAATFYRWAEKALVSAGCYKVCAPFLKPSSSVNLAIQVYRKELSFENSGITVRGHMVPKRARRSFLKNIATLSALLVHNNRADEARQVCEQACKVLEEETLCAELQAALAGQFPNSARR